MLHTILKLSLISMLMLIPSSRIQIQENVTLTIEIEITKYNTGQMAFAIFNDAEQFLKTPVKSNAIEVKDNRATFEFKDLPKGIYSFSYYHDVNSNGELDTNFMGVPKEPYGFSNNQKGTFGPPSFEDAKILIDQNTTLKLTIK